MRTGIANLPLHPGKCPAWLFKRMRLLSREICNIVIHEYGSNELLKRLSDPYWFQAFGNVLGFDWHSSGLTTTVCGALKESVNSLDCGVRVTGGKGKTSNKTPLELEKVGDEFSFSSKKIESLVYSSKLSAKVDNSLVQDGYGLYHHVFFVNEKGRWCVIQQGLNSNTKYARRYHWLSFDVKSFVNEPHSAICSDHKEKNVLDLTSKRSTDTREISLDLINDNPEHLRKYLKSGGQLDLDLFLNKVKVLNMPSCHEIRDMGRINFKTLQKAYEYQPKSYEELVSLKGMGPKTIRALALISELIYGSESSWQDPCKYSFAHGGKDGIPYPVDRVNYDRSINLLRETIKQAKFDRKEKIFALRRLRNF